MSEVPQARRLEQSEARDRATIAAAFRTEVGQAALEAIKRLWLGEPRGGAKAVDVTPDGERIYAYRGGARNLDPMTMAYSAGQEDRVLELIQLATKEQN